MDAAALPVRRLSGRRLWTGALAVAAVSIALRIALLWFVPPTAGVMMTPDSPAYVESAVNLLEHGSFASGVAPNLSPEFNRTPGYPIFLTPFLSAGTLNFPALLWTQAIIGAFTAALLFVFAARLFSERAAWVAGLALGADLVAVIYGVYVTTESLFQLVWVLALGLLLEAYRRDGGRLSAAAGLALGVAAFIRPIALYYAVVAAPFLLLRGVGDRRRRTVKTVVFLLAAFALPFCWSARNRAVSGAWLFSTNGQQNFFYFRAAMMDMQRYGLSRADAVAGLEDKFRADRPGPYPSDAAATMARGSWAVRYLAQNPGAYAAPLAEGTLKLVWGNGLKALVWLIQGDPAYSPAGTPLMSGRSPAEEAGSLARQYPWVVLAMVGYTLYLASLYLLAVRGFWSLGRGAGWGGALLVALPALYSLGLGAGPEAYSRIRIPAMPALCLLAGLGLAPRKGRIAAPPDAA